MYYRPPGPVPRVLLLAESCNPDWPSLPIVGYKYALALANVADVTIVTHIRNKPNIEAAGRLTDRFVYVDNEWLARPMYRLAQWIRGGNEVNWSVSQMMAYPPYIAFEKQALGQFRAALDAGDFDIVHRVTPMSPTLPSYIAGRIKQPFVIGPLNGNLDWPKAFNTEQKREKEGLRKLRGLYRHMPFVRATYTKADCILAAFQHTINDLGDADPSRIVPVPEIGFDPGIFNSRGRTPPFSGKGPKRFLYVGRLVPYKVPEVAIRAFLGSGKMSEHILHVVGSGPEEPRLRRIVAEAQASDRVIFEGARSQAEVARIMRRCDAFVFPSIRELGAGVVIEAMACGLVCLVTDYGAPGDLAAGSRGVKIRLQPLDGLVSDYRAAMEKCLDAPASMAHMAERAETYAQSYYTWDGKAAYTAKLYEAVLQRSALDCFTEYM